MVAHNAPATTTDYGAPVATTNQRSNKLHRPLLLANNVLHWISSLIVMSIAAYLISRYWSNVHMRYWVAVAAIDLLLYLALMAVPALNKYKGHAAPLHWIMSYLWLTAFIFAAQDYSGGRTPYRSPDGITDHSAIKKTLAAFAFLAFLTSLIGTLLEARLYDVNRNKYGDRAAVTDKVHTGPAGTTHTATGAPYTAV